MARRLAVAFALLLALLVVEPAYASPVDGFANGLNDFVHPDSSVSSDITPERDFIESYQPQEVVLSETPSRVYDEDSTTVDYVNGTLDSFNSVPWTVGNRTFLNSIQLMLQNVANSTGFIVVAVGLVFMWWGVRKAVRMIFAAFRRGRMST